jgi:hypothetical protein
MPSPYADPNNIFLQARLRAAQRDQNFKKRVYAALIIHCDERALGCYEAGYRFPDETIVLSMAEAYDDSFLVFEALEQTAYGKFLKSFLGLKVTRDDIPTATIGYLKERNDLNDELMHSMIATGVDTKYDDSERAVVDKVVDETKDFIGRAVVIVCLGSDRVKTKTAVSAAVCG